MILRRVEHTLNSEQQNYYLSQSDCYYQNSGGKVVNSGSCRGIREKGRYLKNHLMKRYRYRNLRLLDVFFKTANDGKIGFSENRFVFKLYQFLQSVSRISIDSKLTYISQSFQVQQYSSWQYRCPVYTLPENYKSGDPFRECVEFKYFQILCH